MVHKNAPYVFAEASEYVMIGVNEAEPFRSEQKYWGIVA
jgi:hypothetical protein